MFHPNVLPPDAHEPSQPLHGHAWAIPWALMGLTAIAIVRWPQAPSSAFPWLLMGGLAYVLGRYVFGALERAAAWREFMDAHKRKAIRTVTLAAFDRAIENDGLPPGHALELLSRLLDGTEPGCGKVEPLGVLLAVMPRLVHRRQMLKTVLARTTPAMLNAMQGCEPWWFRIVQDAHRPGDPALTTEEVHVLLAELEKAGADVRPEGFMQPGGHPWAPEAIEERYFGDSCPALRDFRRLRQVRRGPAELCAVADQGAQATGPSHVPGHGGKRW